MEIFTTLTPLKKKNNDKLAITINIIRFETPGSLFDVQIFEFPV